jgi:putative ABC transport system permease protein
VHLVLKNLLRNPSRTVLTILSVAASFCMLGILAAMYRMFFLAPAAPDQALRLIVRNRISFANPIPLSYESRLQAVPGVRHVMKFQWFGGTYKDSRDPRNMFARFGVEADKLFLIHPEYSISPDELRDFQKQRNSCVLGRGLGARLGAKSGGHITLVGDIFPVTLDLIVRGFYDSARDNENLFFHYDYLNEAAFHGHADGISMF